MCKTHNYLHTKFEERRVYNSSENCALIWQHCYCEERAYRLLLSKTPDVWNFI